VEGKRALLAEGPGGREGGRRGRTWEHNGAATDQDQLRLGGGGDSK